MNPTNPRYTAVFFHGDDPQAFYSQRHDDSQELALAVDFYLNGTVSPDLDAFTTIITELSTLTPGQTQFFGTSERGVFVVCLPQGATS